MTLVMSGFVALMLVGSVIYINYTAKKKNLTLGEVINQMFFREGATFIILLLIFMNVIEAITAASVQRVGEHTSSLIVINPVTRFMMHLLLGFSGAFFAVYTTKALLDFVKSIGGETLKRRPMLWILDLLLLGISAPLSFGLPFINVFIISVACDETELFKIACYQWFMFWKSNAEIGVPDPSFSAVSKMSVVMTSSFFTMFAHYFVSIVDGLIALKDRYEYGLDTADAKRKQKGYTAEEFKKDEKKVVDDKKPADAKKEEKKDDKKRSSGLDLTNKIFEFLNISSVKKEEYKKLCETVLAKYADTSQGAAILNEISVITDNITEFEKGTGDSESRKRKRAELVTDTRAFFRGNPEDGGFGFDPIP